MHHWVDGIMLLLILTNLILLGATRMGFLIRVVAVQGLLLGLLPLVNGAFALTPATAVLAASALALKGLIFPWLLLRALRDIDVPGGVEPFVGYGLSILSGMAALAVCLWLGPRLPLPFAVPSNLMVPVSFFTIFTGWFLLAARKRALLQVLGYLVLENGVYAFGAILAGELPWLVEMGILLDVFVAVFIMGLIIFHISREFNHIDTSRLALLHDWKHGKKGN